MNLLSYQKATFQDLDYLLWLREETMTEHFLKTGISATQQDHIDRVLFCFDNAQLIFLNGQRIGLLKVVEDAERIELVQIQLEPAHQGKGIGQEVLNSIIEKSLREGKPLSLSVLKGNRARKLYERLGFKKVKETDFSLLMEMNKSCT